MKPRMFILASILVLSSCGGSKTQDCRSFLADYGWEVSDKPTASAEVIIPADFDRMYESYNKLQRQAGLDLMPYRGRSGTRYTYEVKNYPVYVSEPVYADVVVIDGAPVAGDIMTVSVHGFMHSLLYPSL